MVILIKDSRRMLTFLVIKRLNRIAIHLEISSEAIRFELMATKIDKAHIPMMVVKSSKALKLQLWKKFSTYPTSTFTKYLIRRDLKQSTPYMNGLPTLPRLNLWPVRNWYSQCALLSLLEVTPENSWITSVSVQRISYRFPSRWQNSTSRIHNFSLLHIKIDVFLP